MEDRHGAILHFSFCQKDLDVNRLALRVFRSTDPKMREAGVQDVGAMPARVHPGVYGLSGIARTHINVLAPAAVADVIGIERVTRATVLTELV